MKRKNKTTKQTQEDTVYRLSRKATIDCRILDQDSSQNISNVVYSVVEEIIEDVCKVVDLQQNIWQHIEAFNEGFKILQNGFYGISPSQPIRPIQVTYQNEPQPTKQVYNPRIVHQSKQNESRCRISKTSSIKSKSMSEQKKYIRMHKMKKLELESRKSTLLLPLINLGRNSQDNSQQIQEVMRRNKELKYDAKTDRLNTQLSKLSFDNKKQKVFYYQDDQGEPKKMFTRKKTKDVCINSLSTARYEPGSTIYQGIKKKPIIEMITTKKRRKRKNQLTDPGQTCILVQKLRQIQQKNSNQILQNMLKKGVTLNLKDHSQRQSVKLPTFR